MGLIDGFIDGQKAKLNKVDNDHDGKSDVAEIKADLDAAKTLTAPALSKITKSQVMDAIMRNFPTVTMFEAGEFYDGIVHLAKAQQRLELLSKNLP